MDNYLKFLERKSAVAAPCGFDPQSPMPTAMKPFQRGRKLTPDEMIAAVDKMYPPRLGMERMPYAP